MNLERFASETDVVEKPAYCRCYESEGDEDGVQVKFDRPAS